MHHSTQTKVNATVVSLTKKVDDKMKQINEYKEEYKNAIKRFRLCENN